MAEDNHEGQRQTAVASYLKSKQLLLFAIARRRTCHFFTAEGNPAGQRQTAVTAYLKSNWYCCLPLPFLDGKRELCNSKPTVVTAYL